MEWNGMEWNAIGMEWNGMGMEWECKAARLVKELWKEDMLSDWGIRSTVQYSYS
jgi:hypothetical protein